MRNFNDRLKITNEQRKEIQRYLNTITINTEESVLKLVRKMKEMERKIEELKYAKR
jgi:hypothetical protein